MDKQPVGQLPELTQSANDDELMIITNSDLNQLKKEKIADFITDLTSTDADNSLIKGSDGKLFVSNEIDSANIEGVLSLDNIPQLTTEKLPDSGVTAGFYRNPTNMSVNNKGQITAVEDGESGVINDITPFVTNCILSSQNAAITKQSYTQAAYVNKGCTVSESNIASGFGVGNYILLSKVMPDANALVLEIPFNVTSVSGIQPIASINNYGNSICIEDGLLTLHYDNNRLAGTTALNTNTDYTFKLERTAGGYTLSLKEGTGAYADEITLSSTIGFFGGKSIYLGSRGNNYLKGTINLAGVNITADGSAYWNVSTPADFETVTVQGAFQLLMPNDRNADLTLNNESATITIDDTLLYQYAGMEKTILVTNEGELMIRDFYAESYEQPSDIRLNGVWFDKSSNMMKTQLNTYPNFLSVGNIVVNTSGKVEGFSADSYVGLPSTYSLGSNWSFAWGAEYDTTASGEQPVVFTPTDDGDFQSFEVIQNGTSLTAKFRRADVFVVNKEVVTSTAYEVQKTDTSNGDPLITTGYVQASGSGYVSAGTQIYSDSAFETPLEEAASDTWSYTGESVENTELITGYTKVGGATLVPADTVVYSDANCTSVQGSATGTDCTYSGSTAESIICTLSDTVTGSGTENVTVGYNGSNYFLNDETYTSTDLVNDDAQIMLGSDGVNSFKSSIELEGMVLTTPIEQWQWNGVNAINPNITTYGTLTNDNGVVSGFSDVNYLRINQSFDFSKPWKIMTKIHTPADLTTRYNDFLGNPVVQVGRFAIGISNTSQIFTFVFDLDADNSSWSNNANNTAYTVLPNTDYWYMAEYTGSQYAQYYSLTGEENSYVENGVASESAPFTTVPYLNLGKYSNTVGNSAYFDGTIDLSETFIYVNNELVWSWNGLTSSVTDFVPFVGAKIGEVVDDGTSITDMSLDLPLSLAKDTDVVHNTGNELIKGMKTFHNPITLTGDTRQYNTGFNSFAGINTLNPNATYEEMETASNGTVLRGARMISNINYNDGSDWYAYIQSQIGVNSTGLYCGTYLGLRLKDDNGEFITPQRSIQYYMYKDGSTYFVFPKATTPATTVSTASDGKIAAVVQNYVNGTSWYRVWSDGWKEQGGRTTSLSQGATTTVTLMKAFTNANYTVLVAPSQSTKNYANPSAYSLTAKNFVVRNIGNAGSNCSMYWYACGY